MVVNLVDNNFVGRDLETNPRYFKWCTENRVVSKHVFFTDYKLDLADKLKTNQTKIAWLLEPPCIVPHTYSFIERHFNKFEHVLTFNRDLISKIDNGLYCPYGTYWVKDKINYQKTKNVSIISSFKLFTEGHKLRHDVIHHIKHIDAYGSHPHAIKINNKNEALDNYKFSVTIENSICNSYWTEKLLDCFVTKTVPIYWGTEDVINFFNKEGIIFFSCLKELDDILSTLTDKDYFSRLNAIEENYKLAKQYFDPEDYIFYNYKHLLT